VPIGVVTFRLAKPSLRPISPPVVRPDSTPFAVSRARSQPEDQLRPAVTCEPIVDPETIPSSDNDPSTLGDIFAGKVTPCRQIYPEMNYASYPAQLISPAHLPRFIAADKPSRNSSRIDSI
jgi:hypothetical protein